MKKIIIIGFCTALLSMYTLANAQQQDTSSVDYNTRTTTEEVSDDVEQEAEQAGNEMQEGAENVTDEVQEGADNASDQVNQSTENASDAVQGAAQSTNQELEETTQQMEEAWKGSAVDAYVGPNNEKLFKKGRKYYYYNDNGERVRVKEKDLKENAESQK